ncbi:MAG TPA: BadF/BadG/BcrA/BcrD ATPase family protein [Verrucomicrobiae bacterium]|nr:BadF/BadG/BcrA/BcrD ATPase family protein [Verrucomicrobiae bacterium]
MPIIVGVDAGGTSIECAIAFRDETILRSGDAANVRTAGIEGAAERIAATVRAGLRGEMFDALTVGAAGAGDPPVASALEAALRRFFPSGTIAVRDDAEIALRAAVPDGDAVALIAGTGSIAYALIGGKTHRAGGYGYLLGDEGSGFSIGRAALAAMLRWYDGRAAHAELFDAIAARMQVTDAQTLLGRMYGEVDPVPAVASIAPLVLDRASAGERLATKIVQTAALELVDLLKALAQRAELGARELPLVFCGGLFSGNSLLSYLVETRLLADLPLLAPVKSAPAPVLGALELARRSLR